MFFEDLLNEYHDLILRNGTIIGFQYGEKFIFDDLQNNRITIDEIKNMGFDEICEYCEKETED